MTKHFFLHVLKILFGFLIIFLFTSRESYAQYPVQKPITVNIDYAIKGYYEWLPPDYNIEQKKGYPLLIFLHGIGEIGDGSKEQIAKLLKNGPPKLINEKKFPLSFNINDHQFSFIVLSPQFNSNARNYMVIDTFVQYALEKYNVDTERIYLTGLSMGGGISWIYAGAKKKFADRLAALLIVCGNTKPYPANVKIIASSNLPVKVMHNSNDPVVPSSYSVDWVNKLNSSLPPIKPSAELTIFDAKTHDAWTRAYDPSYKENGKNVYEWMLSYTRKKAALYKIDN